MLLCGLPGSGKSTVARELAPRIGGEWISSDRLRHELGLRGDYSDAAIERVYREMTERALRCCEAGKAAVLDASFGSRRQRDRVLRAAERVGARAAVILLIADEAISLERVRRRREFSEAREAAFRLLRERFEPIGGEHLTLDAGAADIDDLVAEVEAYLRRPGAA